MKLPSVGRSRVPFAPRVRDQGPAIRSAYSQLGAGFQRLSGMLADMETDRLDQQAQQAAHEYSIQNLNFEAEHAQKTEYSASDPVLQNLSGIKKTEKRLVDGNVVEVPREHIPADEVWPHLYAQQRKQLIEIQADKIESDVRRNDFVQRAEQQAAGDAHGFGHVIVLPPCAIRIETVALGEDADVHAPLVLGAAARGGAQDRDLAVAALDGAAVEEVAEADLVQDARVAGERAEEP